ncbi:hypothetical protein J8L70_09990 [Pseudoalteromonas sp. MMG010]|uniref:Ca2+-dependent phosphoinositide-specific phospholipase C n=1 Tax=Pseudoalteromonas sp. MMG010 TaxID=2822685 RepID=UPI001B3A7859|nr:Ca2+-dependent phosphoinositide-specific phospholipase C [Pseudoalteromonas sp. MMG010]MBQ4833569.1 hypothetical protein [Pseudoalteromonas sp. MMG010]
MPFFIFVICSLLTFCVAATPLNQFQIIGSHNSYKKMLNPDVKSQLTKLSPNLVTRIDYGHNSIMSQLNSGVRHLEIDVLNDPTGNLYSNPWANKVAKGTIISPLEKQKLATAGFKVMHIPDIDVQSDCVLFIDCLTTLKNWSNANEQHFPIVIMLNVKETRSDLVAGPTPLIFTPNDYQLLDKTIKNTLQALLFTPDDLRHVGLTLNQSVVKHGWPNVDALLGRFIFLFDGNHQQNRDYKHQRPSLKGASMFAHYDTNQNEAAFMIVNNPIKHLHKIQQLVAKGYLVRTRADASLTDDNAQRIKQFNAAKHSGAHIISTDFIANSPQHARFNYVVQFDQGRLVRKNPFTKSTLN